MSHNVMLSGVFLLTSGAALLLYFIAWRRGISEEKALYILQRTSLDELTKKLVVIVPARNEAEGIAKMLKALLDEKSSLLSIYVFDDESTDETAAIIAELAKKDARLKLLQPKDVPEEFLPENARSAFGKPWALQRALHYVWKERGHREDAVLFLDADVVLSAGALGGALKLLFEENLDALSGNPQLRTDSIVEELFIPAFISLVASQYLPSQVNNPRHLCSFLNGQFILVRGSCLDEVQGWKNVLGTVLEDVAFAKMLQIKGKHFGLADLRNVAQTQMYSTWAEIRQGFGKNAVELYGGPFRTTALAFMALLLSWTPWLSAGMAFFFRSSASETASSLQMLNWILVLTLLNMGLILGLQALVRKRLGHRAWSVFFLPWVYTGVAFVLVEASIKRWRGGKIHWKGRTYGA